MDSDNLILKLASDAKELLPEIRDGLRSRKKTIALLLIGLTVSIGSSGLLMGAATTALASYLMGRGVEMVPAMNIGFTTVGLASLITGLVLLFATARKLIGSLRL